MKISNCSDPKVVRNKYTGKLVQVPCGKCPSCRLSQGAEWKQKLIEESKLWKYVLFFTLTYDNKYLPTAELMYPEVETINDHSSHEEITSFLLNRWVIRHNVDLDFKTKDNKFFLANISDYEREFIKEYEKICGESKFPVLSKTHAKNFIKICSENARRCVENAKFRIYLIGEYGACSFRPHYHGLFFTNNSEFCEEEFSSCSLANIISVSWCNMVLDNSQSFQFSLGLVDVQKSDKSPRTMSYVSQYLSSITNLPQVFQQKESSPFRICSKERSVGYVEPDTITLSKIFYSGSPSRVVYDPKKSEYNVEILPRSYRTRLFPEHRGFDTINLRNLGAWLVIASLCASSRKFLDFLAQYDINHDYLQLHDILDCTCDENLSSRIKSLYYSLNKSFKVCLEFGCPPCDYGFYYQQFKSKINLFKLKQFYELQENLSHDPLFDCRFLNCLYIDDVCLRKHPVVACDNLDFYCDISNCPESVQDQLTSLKVLLNSTKSKKRNDFLTNKEFAKFHF